MQLIIRSSSNVNNFLNSRMIKHVWAEDWSEEVVPDKVTVIPIGFETNIENLYHVLHEVCINYRAVHTYDDVQKYI